MFLILSQTTFDKKLTNFLQKQKNEPNRSGANRRRENPYEIPPAIPLPLAYGSFYETAFRVSGVVIQSRVLVVGGDKLRVKGLF